MYSGIIQELIEEFAKLPGIGPKSAQRITYHIVQSQKLDMSKLAKLLAEVRERVKFCEKCHNLTEEKLCYVCSDNRREIELLCVVEEPKDVIAIERTRAYRGMYHVLGGSLNPMEGIGPEELNITSLMQRLNDKNITEVIIATDPNLEGEATATYISRIIAELDIKVTRLASGLPVGGDLEFADEVTLGRAFYGRRSF